MAFRCFQDPLPVGKAGKIVYRYFQTNPDTGMSELVSQNQCDKLPDVEMTDLKALLQAGVSLQDVNCKLLNPHGDLKLSAGETQTQTQIQITSKE